VGFGVAVYKVGLFIKNGGGVGQKPLDASINSSAVGR